MALKSTIIIPQGKRTSHSPELFLSNLKKIYQTTGKRNKKGKMVYSMRKTAKLTGISPASVSRYLSHKREPGQPIIRKSYTTINKQIRRKGKSAEIAKSERWRYEAVQRDEKGRVIEKKSFIFPEKGPTVSVSRKLNKRTITRAVSNFMAQKSASTENIHVIKSKPKRRYVSYMIPQEQFKELMK